MKKRRPSVPAPRTQNYEEHGAQRAPYFDRAYREALLFPDGSMAPDGSERAPHDLVNERNPISQLSGKEAAVSRVEREWSESLEAGGFWDHDQAASESSRLGPPRSLTPKRAMAQAKRHDAEHMAQWLAAHGHELADRQQEIAVEFWSRRSSYTVCARRLGIAKQTVMNVVKLLRGRARA